MQLQQQHVTLLQQHQMNVQQQHRQQGQHLGDAGRFNPEIPSTGESASPETSGGRSEGRSVSLNAARTCGDVDLDAARTRSKRGGVGKDRRSSREDAVRTSCDSLDSAASTRLDTSRDRFMKRVDSMDSHSLDPSQQLSHRSSQGTVDVELDQHQLQQLSHSHRSSQAASPRDSCSGSDDWRLNPSLMPEVDMQASIDHYEYDAHAHAQGQEAHAEYRQQQYQQEWHQVANAVKFMSMTNEERTYKLKCDMLNHIDTLNLPANQIPRDALKIPSKSSTGTTNGIVYPIYSHVFHNSPVMSNI